MGILDNDYKAAFDFMVLLWVFKVLRAKGLSEQVISRLKNLYSNNITIVVVNNILGKSFLNNRWSIRQGDRPSSILFCYGIDPHLTWLHKRLQGIPVYHIPMQGPVLRAQPFPPMLSETFKLIGYIDDVKPAITAMSEFSLVDNGSLLFEKASGCILHRDPTSGKVKFLPLGRWRGSLTQEDLPVNYIALSDHLDMVGVQLKATHTQTRKSNGDLLQERVTSTINPWRGGKFMEITQRGHSVNNYCLSKIWFKAAYIDLRVLDVSKITSSIKSWIYADQLEKPQELVLYRSRKEGGLNVNNVKCRALAEQIKSFLDTAVNPKFRNNIYHRALYDWHVLDIRTIPDPGRPPYYSVEFFTAIKSVKNEGLLNVATLSLGHWYKALLENYVTTEVNVEGFRFKKNCKIESDHPNVDWERTWSLACIKGLESENYSFLWKLVHNILPTQERLSRILVNITSPVCTLCDANQSCNLVHAMFLCNHNSNIAQWLLQLLRKHVRYLTPQQVILLDMNLEEKLKLPFIWLIANTLGIIWNSRVEKKATSLITTRAVLEANIMLLRKTRFKGAAEQLNLMMSTE